MGRFILLFLLVFFSGLPAQEATLRLTTPEAQAVLEANTQRQQHWWSTYNIAMQQLAILLAAISLAFNVRSAAFVFFIIFAIFGLKTPYYIPTAFKNFADVGILIVAILGILARFFFFRSKAKESNQK